MNNSVSIHPLLTLVAFILLVIVLFFLIAKWKWHVFLAMLIPIIFFGIIPGIQQDNFINAFEEGFGKTLGKIGVVIVLGSVIAEALKHTGAIKVITQSIIKLVGSKRIPLALTFTGFILGIAIFSDVAYVILNPLVHASALATNTGIAAMSTGLVGSLQLTHAIVPPTPGPLAAAALVGADIGKTIIYGGICCLFGSVSCWAWGKWVAGPRIKTLGNPEFALESEKELQPYISVVAAYAPIIVPIVLISLHSVARLYLDEGNFIRPIITYLGWPVCALTVGVWLAYRNVYNIEHKADSRSKWIENALRGSAMILVVTGLGGSLSEILKGTPIVNFITDFFVHYQLPAIILPFLIGVIGNMITGSTTVGVITAASIAAPMLGDLNLSPEAAMLSGASGSVIIKYVNSSYFWVCTSLSRLSVNEGMLAYGGATLIGGLVTFFMVCVLWGSGLI
ncbi:MAG TPA: gluconate:proton symporter [Cytophagales bacterium]|nr:gluconate:proton symporter [Cytophagales bacterium]HCR54729.1 gluconate:proton symporter [Cytophagales bacterium]